MEECEVCWTEYKGDSCPFCERNKKFSELAKSYGLTRYPDPTGERYVYNLDGSCAGKKTECTDFIDELWNALVAKDNGDLSI